MLAINTAFMTANLALETPDGRTIYRELDAHSKHSENVLKTIDEMCQEGGVDVLDMETVAVVVGPGSFTGLRIGTAIAKALGCVNKKLKFIGLSSLELMANIVLKNKLCSENFVCVLNALSDLYFVAYFDKTGIILQEERMIDKQEYLAIKQPIFGLKGDLQDDRINQIEITSEDLFTFAKKQEKLGKFVALDELLPVYLRLSQAEDNLLKKSKKD